MTIQNVKVLRNIWLPIIILIVAGSFVYSFNLNNKLFWDDDDWIINNNFVHSTSWDNIKFWFSNSALAGVGLQSNYYRPFLFFTFALNYSISGVEPLLYHLLSNYIHVFNSILVFWLIRLVFKRNPLAFLVALFFLVHPLQTEAVTYISGRGDLLVTMFMLLALLFFYKSESVKDNSGNFTNKSLTTYYLLLTTFFLIFSLLSRETAIIFPVLALAFYVSVLSPDRFVKSLKTGLVKTWPYFAVVIVYGVLRLTLLNFINTLNFYTEQNLYSENVHVRLFTFLSILWEYLKLLIVPLGLHMERGATVYTSLFQWPVWGVAAVLVGILYILVRFYRLEIRNLKLEIQQPNSSYRIWLLGVSWFFIALGPVSGITPINALIYEHWLYLPMVGFWLIISYYLVKLFDYLKSRNLTTYYLLLTTVVAYFSFFSYQSIQHNKLWGNEAEFYKNILKYEPKSTRVNNNLGNFYYNEGDFNNAEIYYQKATEGDNTFAQPYYNLGSIFQARGDIKTAIQLYKKAIEIDPNFYYSYQNLAVIYAQRGDLVEAVKNIEKLKTLIPANPRVYYNSALVYLALNNKEQALTDLKEGLKHSSLDPETGRLIEELIKELQ